MPRALKRSPTGTIPSSSIGICAHWERNTKLSTEDGKMCQAVRTGFAVIFPCALSVRRGEVDFRMLLPTFSAPPFSHRLWDSAWLGKEQREARLFPTVLSPQVVHASDVPEPCHVPEHGYRIHFQWGPSGRGPVTRCSKNSTTLLRRNSMGGPLPGRFRGHSMSSSL